jgi:hypothetical protein
MKTFLTALLLIGFAAPAFAATSSPVNPNGSLKSGISIAQRARGNCWTTSISSSASNAYRCMIGNNIVDPCFAASRAAKIVYCPMPSSSRKVLALTLTGPLPAN